MSLLQKLTADVQFDNRQKEMSRYIKKWSETGLLEGIKSPEMKGHVAQLLQNEAKFLKEMTSMGAGDIEGFAAVAFPLVRRIFGQIIASELVSVQSLKLPNGLIFYLDFTYTESRFGKTAGDSVFGQFDRGANTPAVASDIVNGVSIIGQDGRDPGGFYNLGGTYSSVTGTRPLSSSKGVASDRQIGSTYGSATARVQLNTSLSEAAKKLLYWDQDLLDIASASATTVYDAIVISVDEADLAVNSQTVFDGNYPAVQLTVTSGSALWTGSQGSTQPRVINRLTRKDELNSGRFLITLVGATTAFDATTAVTGGLAVAYVTGTFPIKDAFTSAGDGALKGVYPWGLEVPGGTHTGDNANIPEIDIKLNHTSVTVETKKLKAKWTIELSQDLNAYHAVDAEVELTELMSELVAMEIDQEILVDLIKGATAGTIFWSRRPGNFVNRETGVSIASPVAPPDFFGTPSDWNQTLVDHVNDVSSRIFRKTLFGGATFLVTSPEVANILEQTNGFRGDVVHDQEKGSVGSYKSGSVNKKWDVYVSPQFIRNLILVGRKGKAMETGYIYAPYQALLVTPTIFDTESFLPRKAVSTRYAKKMVRPDMYGLVVVRDLLG